jgi:hypothetical protein
MNTSQLRFTVEFNYVRVRVVHCCLCMDRADYTCSASREHVIRLDLPANNINVNNLVRIYNT